jgi:hypothetical protein
MAFCEHRQVAAEGFFVFGQFGQFLMGTRIYWLIIGQLLFYQYDRSLLRVLQHGSRGSNDVNLKG